jgi:hypothetical protein
VSGDGVLRDERGQTWWEGSPGLAANVTRSVCGGGNWEVGMHRRGV